MGLLTELNNVLPTWLLQQSSIAIFAGGSIVLLVLSVVWHTLRQVLFQRSDQPPVVFSIFPWIGSTVDYGRDPFAFFERSRKKYGDIFTFTLLGKPTTTYLGPKGNDFILNCKLSSASAEEVYSPLCTPIFGKDVVYDCPNSTLMQQKKMVKYGLTGEALRSYVKLITEQVDLYLKSSTEWQGQSGTVEVTHAIAELVIYTASRSLQGKEVRDGFDSSFAALYHDLDGAFVPINSVFPGLPLPINKRRDAARMKMATYYAEIIRKRREKGQSDEHDMLGHLMSCSYKEGGVLPDHHICGMLIALLMAGQHSSSSTFSWILLHLAAQPGLFDELYQEQIRVLGSELPTLTYDSLLELPLNAACMKEALRTNAPIHSVMRKVKEPIPVPGTPYTIPTSHVLLAAPGVSAREEEYFIKPLVWDPHRWLNMKKEEVDEEKVDYGWGEISKGGRSPYLPFGSGRHRCIGQSFAEVQIGTLLALFVRTFKLKTDTGVPPTDFSSLFSRPLGPAYVHYTRR